jgi:hypothetical protein
MQYILTQEEYDELKRVREMKQIAVINKLQMACTFVCDNMPISQKFFINLNHGAAY